MYGEAFRDWKGSLGPFQSISVHSLYDSSMQPLNIFVFSWLPFSEGHPAESCLCYCESNHQQWARCSKDCVRKDGAYIWADNLMREKFLKVEEKIHKFVLPFASLVFPMWS